MGKKVNSVAGRPPRPPSNLMVGTQRPKSAPSTVEVSLALPCPTAAVVSSAAGAVAVVVTSVELATAVTEARAV